MKTVLIDNFDSFSYNLAHLLAVQGADVEVVRNNCSLAELQNKNPGRIVISPGPGRPPDDTGVCCEAINFFTPRQIPILGVCLGHQAIGQVFGGKVVPAKQIMHGKASQIHHNGQGLFAGLPTSGFPAARYHSLAVDRSTLPNCLEVTAQSQDGEIMAIRHRQFTSVCGVQFHPESVLTADPLWDVYTGNGAKILANFLSW